ncbi:MAG: hypothetical protein IT384_19755 [Deltaproteobacteria bacterium]|nr:hypothetical protein [Deltaproteobacteria bacterium]
MMKRAAILASVLAVAGWGRAAGAEEAAPHHVRASAMLELADQEAKLLYAVLTAKVFDVELSMTLASDLVRAIGEAKSSVFRAEALLDEAAAKSAPELKKIQDTMKAAEESARKLENDLKQETKGLKEDESEDIAPAAGSGPSEAKTPSWDLLKDDVGQLYKELSEAKAGVARTARVVKPPVLKAPPPPKAKKG